MQVRTGNLMLPASLEGWIDKFGDDFGFMPLVPVNTFTEYEPGTPERSQEMRRRLRRGQPLFSRHDMTRDPNCRVYTTDPKWTVWSGTKKRGTEQSVCGEYRYRVWDTWDADKPVVVFIGLFAERQLSSSIDRKCISIAERLGFGGYQRVNLFAKLTGSMDELWSHEDPIGDWNDRVIRIALLSARAVICCWGRPGQYLGRSPYVCTCLDNTMRREDIYCFGLTDKTPASCGSGEYFRHPISLSKVGEEASVVNLPMKFVERVSNG